MNGLLRRARELVDDHEYYEHGCAAADMVKELAEALEEALALLRHIRADGVMEDWAGDLPQRIDALLQRLGNSLGELGN